jgi:methyl-accepting chemotaxis protein
MQLSGIKAKLTLVIVLILVITAANLVGMNYWSTRNILLEDTAATLSAQAGHNADKLGMWLKTRTSEIAVLANTPEVVSDDRATAIAYLQAENRRNPIYAFFFLVDLDGNAELTTGAKPNVVDRPYFQAARAGKIAISDPLLSKVDGKPLVVIASPILRDGLVSGVLAATVSLGDMIDLVNKVKIGKSGYAYVVQHDGLTIFHPDVKLAMQQNALQDPATDASLRAILEKMIIGAQGTSTYATDGQERYAAFAPIPGTSWSMAVNVPSAEMTGKLGDLLRTSLLFLAVALGLAVILTLIVAGRFSRPLVKAVAMIEGLGRGELDRRLKLKGRDEVARLGQNLDAFADSLQHEILAAFEALAGGDLTFNAEGVIKQPQSRANLALNRIMRQIHTTTEQIAAGSNQVAESSQTLSQGATVQASSLEEISASLSQMAAQTGTTAQNANQANLLTTEVQQAAHKGNRQMQTMVEAMHAIETSGQNIFKIIKTIDEIAFQTNLLALNAAVEAARAGQHGKGFAVVAEEVRNLAARSAKAAEETALLIEGSVEKTRNGTGIATQTAEAFEEIVGGVAKVNDLISEIAAASNEQAAGISQISQGINQIDQITQQNTANAEESAAAAEELSGQALQLRQILQHFTLQSAERTARSRPLTATTNEIQWVMPAEPPAEESQRQLQLQRTPDERDF